jgi:hypothetical protein
MSQSKGWNGEEWKVPSGRILGNKTSLISGANVSIDASLSNRFHLSTNQSTPTIDPPTNPPVGSTQGQGFILSIFANGVAVTPTMDTVTNGFHFTDEVPSIPTIASGNQRFLYCEWSDRNNKWWILAQVNGT